MSLSSEDGLSIVIDNSATVILPFLATSAQWKTVTSDDDRQARFYRHQYMV